MAEKDKKIKKEEAKEKVVEEKIDKGAKESTKKEDKKVEKENTTSEEKSKKADNKKEKNLKDEIKEKAEGIEEKLNIDTDELKNETKDTVNQVKEVFSNGDFKEKTTEATHFVKGAFTNPFETIEEIATEKNEVFPKAVLLIVLYTAITFVSRFISLLRHGENYHFGQNVSAFISSITSPLIYILVTAAIIYLFNRNNRKKLTTTISTVTTCYIPVIIAAALSLVRNIIPDLAVVANPLISAAKAISIILLYFGIKSVLEENDDKHYMIKFFFIFAIIQFILLLLSNISFIFSMVNI